MQSSDTLYAPQKGIVMNAMYAIEEDFRPVKPPPPADGGPLFFFDGFYLTREQLDSFLKNIRDPVAIAGTAAAAPNIVHLFDSPEAFEAWGSTTRFSSEFGEISNIISRSRVGLPQESPRSSGVGLVSNVPIEREWSTVPVYRPVNYEASAMLYDAMRYRGTMMRLGPAAVADLSDLDFANKLRSMTVRGVAMLTDKTDFGGFRFYITGDPLIEVPDMIRWGFDKAARSMIVL
jgi:hypothetical protein